MKSRIRGAINLCIPTTLLKRATFDLQKLEETLASAEERARFAGWKTASRIIAYDASATHMKDAASLLNVLKKFKDAGYCNDTFILHGGFSHFQADFPNCLESPEGNGPAGDTVTLSAAATPAGRKASAMRLNLSLPKPGVVGGCPMPTTVKAPANPFFSNIRQNIELTNGVGQIPIHVPELMSGHERQQLPEWLRNVITDSGKSASERFLKIEKAEQSRMREAYTMGKQPPPSAPAKPDSATEGFRIAGIEKGTKNRYKDIYPFDHSRVRLKRTSQDSCDYVNASFIKSSRSNRQYIATQAPIPSTFADFWRLVWEQDARAIVMLTAELEGFHVKCHPYWKDGVYGDFHVRQTGQEAITLESPSHASPSDVAAQDAPISPTQVSEPAQATGFPGLGPANADKAAVSVIVRRLQLTRRRGSTPTESTPSGSDSRDIVQIQFSGWPDFGKPTKPAHLLKLLDVCQRVFQQTNADRRSTNENADTALEEPVPPDQHNIVVHCSAGCGRTGTFCTIDSVIDMLKHQRIGRQRPDQWTESSQWIYQDDVDLVAETVEEFRHQRLSMVQTLQQFVLCYESILEWIAAGNELRR
ncbi:hypothetical protein KEM52_005737 [Ascosphaera acerosa]|nr:hypothetical protein KEM52_005737 [Ascosphaera acerosa]